MTGEPASDPGWPACKRHGCVAIPAAAQTHCLAHLDMRGRREALAALGPGADLDVRGTRFTDELLRDLLTALQSDGVTILGAVKFSGARFEGEVDLRGARFQGPALFEDAVFVAGAVFNGAMFTDQARFDGAHFTGRALLNRVRFAGQAHFDRVRFDSHTWFQSTDFSDNSWFRETRFAGAPLGERPQAADFRNARFGGLVEFHSARFAGDVMFGNTRFERTVWLHNARVEGDADFSDARFTAAEQLGPVVVTGALRLDRAVFEKPVQIEAAASYVFIVRAAFEADLTLRLRHAKALLHSVGTTGPLTLTGAAPFRTVGHTDGTLPEDGIEKSADGDASPHLLTIAGVDASRLVLCDVDLTGCRFADAYNLERLRIEGLCRFPVTPARWRVARGWPPLWHWTRRQTLVEEHTWRASQPHPAPWPAPALLYDRPEDPLSPQRLAGLYRQLRKAHEDAKNEPGAADFYYGEMEMRRHAHTTSTGERIILTLYWLLSGYGLRATRALTALAALVPATTALLVAYGLPRQAAGAWSVTRIDQALRITLNSVIFHSIDQPLTPAGSYIEMTTRFAGPILLVLALLAFRNRVKR